MLLLLSRILIVYQPLNFAIGAVSAMGAWSVRGGVGLAMVLLVRAGATAIGIAAGQRLGDKRPGAIGFARVAVMMSAVADAIVYLTPYMPNNRVPGDTALYLSISLAIHAFWLVYLFRHHEQQN